MKDNISSQLEMTTQTGNYTIQHKFKADYNIDLSNCYETHYRFTSKNDNIDKYCYERQQRFTTVIDNIDLQQ